MNEQLAFYEKLFELANKLRTAHWHAKKHGGKQAIDREYRAGLELDKRLRKENLERQRIKAELNNYGKTN